MPNPTLIAGTKNNGTIGAGVSTITVTSTGSVTIGHLLIVTIMVSGATAPTAISPPAGWTTTLATTTTASGGVVSAAIFTRAAASTASFSGAFTWTTTSTAGGEWSFSEWSGAGASLIDGSPTTSLNTTSTTPPSPTITPSAGNVNDTLVCVLFDGALGSTTITIPTGMSSVLTVAGTASQLTFGMASLALSSASATGSKAWTLGTTETTLGVSLLIQQTPWVPPEKWIDSVPPDRTKGMKYQRGMLSVPFFQVWYPPFRWEDFARRVPKAPDFPATTIGLPPIQVWFPHAPWDDFANKAKPIVDLRPWTFVPPPAQVWFSYGPWDDFTRRSPRPSDFPTTTLGRPPPQVWYPPNYWDDFAKRAAPRPPEFPAWTFGQPPIAVPGWNAPTPWPDLTNRRAPPLNSDPLTFVPVVATTPAPTMDSWVQWPDFATVATPRPYLRGRLMVGFSQVWYPPGNWPDTAPARRRPVEFPQPSFVPVVVTTPAPVMAWTQWPDFARRRTPPTDPQSFAFMALTPSATTTVDWPDFFRRTRTTLADLQVFVPVVATTPAPTMDSWLQWPEFIFRARQPTEFPAFTFGFPPIQIWRPVAPWADFAPKKPSPADSPQVAFVQLVATPTVTWNGWTQWPDIVPYKAKPVTDFQSWKFIEPPPQVWFPPIPWGDFATKQKPPLNFDPLTFIPINIPKLGYLQWPDFIYKKTPPLNYNPLTYTQPVIAPWNAWTQWPDFAPIRSKIGQLARLQPALFLYPGTIAQVPVTGIMLAFEIDADAAIFAINVVPNGNPGIIIPVSNLPAVSALVSIHESGKLLQGGQ